MYMFYLIINTSTHNKKLFHGESGGFANCAMPKFANQLSEGASCQSKATPVNADFSSYDRQPIEGQQGHSLKVCNVILFKS